MLIIRKQSTSDESARCRVRPIPTGWRIELLGLEALDRPFTFEFDLKQVYLVPDIAYLIKDGIGQPALVWGSDIYNDRVACAHALFRANVPEMTGVIAAFAVESADIVHCLVSRAPVDVGDKPCVVDDSPVTSSALLSKHLPFVEAFMRRAHAKRRLLANAPISDSLSALEKQVDLLSALVVEIAAKVPGSESALATEIKTLVEQNGANAGKTTEQAVASIVDFKARLRNLQAEYFASR